jgi:hypothetical protein
MTPSITNGAAAETHEYGTNDMTHDTLLFDGLAQNESAEFDLVMPESWDLGTIKWRLYWAPGHADANVGEYIEFELAAAARGDDDPMDAAVGTLQVVEDVVLADDDMHISAASAALTVGGTPSIREMVHFKLTRDYDHAGIGVAMDVDARVFGVLIQYQKNVATTIW